MRVSDGLAQLAQGSRGVVRSFMCPRLSVLIIFDEFLLGSKSSGGAAELFDVI